MSAGLVNAETGELIATMTPDEAREVTDRIKTAVGVTWELIADAYKRRAWAALGFPSWDLYTEAEFGGSRLRLPREERQDIVASLRESGLSTRAIAAATGQSESNVRNDLAAGAQKCAPDDSPEVEQSGSSATDAPSGDEGQGGTGSPPGSDLPAPTDEEEGDAVLDAIDRLKDAADEARAKRITGIDGKEYPDKTAARIADIRLLVAQGKTATEIAEALDITREALHSFNRSHGITIEAGNTRAAVAARIGKVKAMAKEGYTSRQIAAELGMKDVNALTTFRTRHGIDAPPADATVGNTRVIASDRIVTETVSTLEGLVMGLGLVEMDDLDPDQIDDWASSMRTSLTALNRFSKQLKEKTQ